MIERNMKDRILYCFLENSFIICLDWPSFINMCLKIEGILSKTVNSNIYN